MTLIQTMQANVEQLQRISIFAHLERSDLLRLQPHTVLHPYIKDEIIMYDGDRLQAGLYAVVAGAVRVSKMAATGKETIFRSLAVGEIFAAPALFGNGIAPATVTAQENSQIVIVAREALLDAIRATPEIAFQILSLFNQRLQQMHQTIHGLVSERAIVRLVHYIQYFAAEQGITSTPDGDYLRSHLSYYQIARSIGITYEECVRLFKQLQPVVHYQRGGKILVKDWSQLEAIEEL